MKNLIIQKLTMIVAFFFMLSYSITSFSINNVNITLSNASSNSNEIEFDIFIKNNGPGTMSLWGAAFGVNIGTGMLNGGAPGLTAFSYIPNSKDPSLSTIFTESNYATQFSNSQMKCNIISNSYATMPMLNGTAYKLGRFILVNTVPWTCGAPELSLQLSNQLGKTECQLAVILPSATKIILLPGVEGTLTGSIDIPSLFPQVSLSAIGYSQSECAGGGMFSTCNGGISLSIANGNASYNGSINPGGATFSNSVSMVNYCAGTYTVSVADANGCTATTTVVVDLIPACTNTNSLTINTGWDPTSQTKIPYSMSNIDPKWTVKTPSSSDFNPIIVFSASAIFWQTTSLSSNWIYGGQDLGNYTYRRKFRTCTDEYVTFNMQMSYDNELICLKLDNNSIICPNPGDPINDLTFSSFVPYSFTVFLTAGEHDLDFIVFNEGGPTGLHINGTITSATNSLVSNTSPANCCCPAIGTTTILTDCDHYIWALNNANYTVSGIYTTVYGGAIHTLVLTINNSTSNTSSVTACDSYTWAMNGMTYTTSGTYTTTSINAAGCTHTEILNLTINQTVAVSSTVVACDSYSWMGMTLTASDVYTISNVEPTGCLYSETLNLTINPSPVVTAPNINACPNSMITLGGSPAGGAWDLPNPYSGSAGSYSYYYTDANGCTGSATAAINTVSASVSNLAVVDILGISAKATWTSVGGIAWYEVRYKETSSSVWTTATAGSSPSKLLSNLMPNTSYEIQVRGYCSTNNVGAWSASVYFNTNNQCGVPTGLVANNITSTTAKLNWSTTGAGYYSVRCKMVSTATWPAPVTTVSPNKNIAGLIPATNYEFQIKSHCGSSSSTFSPSSYFTTANSKSSNNMQEGITNSNQLMVYPNPAHQSITIELNVENTKQLTFNLLDMSGRVVKQMMIDTNLGKNEIPMDLSDISNGVYLLQVLEDNHLKQVTRVIKE